MLLGKELFLQRAKTEWNGVAALILYPVETIPQPRQLIGPALSREL
jgi:hypothetical protein